MWIGLDIGTSAVKAAACDLTQVRAVATVPLTLHSPHPGWSEQAPTDWWAAVGTALAALGRDVDLSAARAVGLSGQMHGAVLLDAGHEVLRPAILWNDSRATEACTEIAAAVPEVGTLAGVPPLPGFTAPKLLWLSRAEPACHARIRHVLLPKDYIGLRLHGELATDPSDAAGTLWLDQGERRWDDRLALASATDPAWLPPLRDGHQIVGRITRAAAAQTGLPQGLPVVTGGGDAATGAVALGATEPGRGFLSLGTSGQLFVAGDSYRPNPERFVHGYAHTVPGRWFQMAAMLNGARPMAWLAGQLGIDAGAVAQLAAGADPARVPLFLPYLTGERSPHGDPQIRGAFYGLEDSTDRAALCRAVVEAIAFCFADAADSFGAGLDAVPELAAIGGGARSDFLLQAIASVTGKPVGRTVGAEAGPAFGAARLAAVGTGDLALPDLSDPPVLATRFAPRPDPLLEQRLGRYRALYTALKTMR